MFEGLRRGFNLTAFVLLNGGFVLSCLQDGPALEDFCPRYVDHFTQRLSQCLGSTPDAWFLNFEGDTFCSEVLLSNNEGRTRYHPELADPCLRVVDELPCDTIGGIAKAGLEIRCSETLSGEVPPGDPCWADRECPLDYHCDDSAAFCHGLCQPLQDLGEGCDLLNLQLCLPGLNCVFAGRDDAGKSISACKLPLDAGAPCMLANECGSGLFCDPSVAPMACAPMRDGGPCRTDGQDCAAKSVCVSSGTCAVAIAENNPCTVGANQCETFNSCMAIGSGMSGSCVRWGDVGATCGNIGGENVGCMRGGCVLDGGTGLCTLRAAGDLCGADAECGYGGACLSPDAGDGMSPSAPQCFARCRPS